MAKFTYHFVHYDKSKDESYDDFIRRIDTNIEAAGKIWRVNSVIPSITKRGIPETDGKPIDMVVGISILFECEE